MVHRPFCLELLTFRRLFAPSLATDAALAGLINYRTVFEEEARGGRLLEGEPCAAFGQLTDVKAFFLGRGGLKVVHYTC